MSTIIGIHSGRNGGISEQALQHLLAATGLDYRVFALTELRLETCDACLGCLSTNRCVKDNDGVNEIIDSLREASALVFAAPEYWEGVHGKARAFWERVCFSGRHNEAFPLEHLHGVVIGVSGDGDSSAAIRDLKNFYEDAHITLIDAVAVQGTYACYDCGLAAACEVSGVWEIFPRGTEISSATIPSIANQAPHLPEEKRTRNVRCRLSSAGETLTTVLNGGR